MAKNKAKIARRGGGSSTPSRFSWRRILMVVGPGLVVMLADTDAGSIITAAQSGAQWGYKLLPLQIILIPILFVVQDLTVRLGLITGKGHGELIRKHFGRGWAWVSLITLLVACMGALLSELSGLVGVGIIMNIPPFLMMALVVGALTLMAVTQSYLAVERIAIALGAFELAFLAVAWLAKPSWNEAIGDLTHIPFTNPGYLYLISANIGAVIMPWMVFFQQSSVVEKKLSLRDLPLARFDTGVGAVITQLVMIALLITTAATLGQAGEANNLDTVEAISHALTPYLGEFGGKLLFCLGMSGASLVATIVVTLTAARTAGEVMGFKHSLVYKPMEAPLFYGVYIICLLTGAAIILSGVGLVNLSIGVEVMNALLLPIVLGFLFLLARRLPSPHRLTGPYMWLVAAVMVITTGFGVYAGLAGLVR